MLIRFPVPTLLQAEKSQLSQPLLVCQMLQFLPHLCGLALDSSQHVHVSQVLRGPSTVSQMYFPRVEQRGRITFPGLLTMFCWYSPGASWLSLLEGVFAALWSLCSPGSTVSPELLWAQPPPPTSVWGYPAPCRKLELGTNEKIEKPPTWGSQKPATPGWRLSPLSLWLEVEHLPKEWEASIGL